LDVLFFHLLEVLFEQRLNFWSRFRQTFCKDRFRCFQDRFQFGIRTTQPKLFLQQFCLLIKIAGVISDNLRHLLKVNLGQFVLAGSEFRSQKGEREQLNVLGVLVFDQAHEGGS
jgi:hypothetical protein